MSNRIPSPDKFLEASLWLHSAGAMALIASRSLSMAERTFAAEHARSDLKLAVEALGFEIVERHAGEDSDIVQPAAFPKGIVNR